MNAENVNKACESYEIFLTQLREAHTDAVNSDNPFAEMVFFGALGKAVELGDELSRIRNAAQW